MKQRIARRAALSESCIRELQLQARILIADSAELKAALAALRHLHRTLRKHAAAHHQRLDLPAHRPSDDFPAECQRIMKRHGIGPKEAATIIVRQIAPTLPDRARTDLVGSWRDSIFRAWSISSPRSSGSRPAAARTALTIRGMSSTMTLRTLQQARSSMSPAASV